MPYPGLLHPEPLPLWRATADPYLHRRHSNTILAQSLWGLWVLVHTRFVWALWAFHPSYNLAGASPLPLDVGYPFLVGSNILQLTVVQQWVVVLEFSQEKISTRPSVLCDSPISPVVQGRFRVIFFSEAIPTHAVTQHLLFLLFCFTLNSPLPALVQSLLTCVIRWVLSSLGFYRMISLGEGKAEPIQASHRSK